MRRKGTQSLVQELYDSLLVAMETEETVAVIQTYQSKAYDVVDHPILIAKMTWLGFNRKAINIMSSYLEERRQYVIVDSFDLLRTHSRTKISDPRVFTVLYAIYHIHTRYNSNLP